MKQHLLTILFLALSLTCGAQNRIYVDGSIDKEGEGTKQSPYRTLETAVEALTCFSEDQSVVVELASGDYFLESTLNFDNSHKAKISIEGAKNGGTRVSGAIKISDWKWSKDGAMLIAELKGREKLLAQNSEQFYVNGKRATRARTPDSGWYYLDSAKQIIHDRGTGRVAEYATQKLYTSPENLSSLEDLSSDERSQVVAMFYHKWDNTRKYIDYLQKDSSAIFISGTGMKPWNALNNQTRFTLENYKGALSEAGEYFLDLKEGLLYYYPREGEDPSNLTGYLPILNRLISIKGTPNDLVSDISFSKIAFAHSLYTMPLMGNAPEQAAASIEAAIEVSCAENIAFEDCEIRHTGGYALWFRDMCRHSQLKGSYLYDLGAGGVKIGNPYLHQDQSWVSNHITIDNNIIQSAGHVLPCGIGVGIFHASNNRVVHNDISDILYSGVSVGWMWGYKESGFIARIMDAKGEIHQKFGHYDNPSLRNEIAYNHIHHLGWGELSDMGAVYTLGESRGTHIHHNVIHDIYTYSYGGWGLYTDEGSTQVVMENNVVWGCKNGGFHQHYGRENIIRNNIFAFSQQNQLMFTRIEKHRSLDFTSNIVYIDHGSITNSNWRDADVLMDRNLYWDMRERDTLKIQGMNFAKWSQFKDSSSMVADPMFKDPYNFDFTPVNTRALKEIGFKSIDFTKAGVYGSRSWIEKAKLSPQRIEQFNAIVRAREKSYPRIYNAK